MSERRRKAVTAQRWVIKIGSALITCDGRGLDEEAISAWVAQLARLHQRGCEMVLVSSGAIAEGMRRLGLSHRPHLLHQLQAAAAIGQMGLIQTWESHFKRHGLHTAQILLTHDDAADRKRYLNVRSTLRTLLAHDVIPVVNENDCVAFDEIRFGDNDSLGALVTNLIEADLFLILTDQRGLYTANPRLDKTAQLVEEAEAGDPTLEAMASSEGGTLGRGGMYTKVRAAAKAARSGASTLLAYGREPELIDRLLTGEPIGTLLYPQHTPLAARKQWLAAQLQLRGRLRIDQGAVRALRDRGGSLLAVGVTAVEGHFKRGELVAAIDPQGREVMRGLVNYDAEEAVVLMGQPSDQFETLLGYVDALELIHRDNLVLI